MGSLLSLMTPETLVLAVVTVTCGFLTDRFILSNSTTSSPQPTSSGSPQHISAFRVTGSKSKKKNRGAPNRRNAAGEVVGGKHSQLEPLHDAGSGLGATSSKVERKADPVVTSFSQIIPGGLEVQTKASTSASSITQHSSQEPGVAAAKRGKKKRAKASAIPSGSSVAAADQDKHGESGPRESSARSGSAVAKSAFAASEHIPQPQIHPQPKPVKQVTLLECEPSRLRSSPSFDTDSSWTRVELRRLKQPESDGNADANVVVATDFTCSDVGAFTAGDSTVAENTEEEAGDPTVRTDTRRTLAEKFVPKPRRTGVEDMLQRPDVPSLERVMRVIPRAGEMPAPGFTWGDYEDVAAGNLTANDADGEDEAEGGWGIVKGKSRSWNQRTTPTPQQITKSTPEQTMTKKQRQNAKKREMIKAVKAEAEATRLEGLAKHKRELERERIIELSRSGGGKRLGSGMQATVDDKGKLVWE